ncbi:MAG TPA: hypothetical protein VFN48_07530 [Solirubrobacteraceae bacterium]|nr:hypothetical protein [Solirubrobacteraceae bacterium]
MNVEALLREALAPVEPPSSDALLDELQVRLRSWTDAAQDELESWELSAMRNPRNWGRPAAALAVTASAGTALVLLRLRQGHGTRVTESANLRELAERTLADAVEETKRVLS